MAVGNDGVPELRYDYCFTFKYECAYASTYHTYIRLLICFYSVVQ